MPNPSSHVTETFRTFPVDLGVSVKALTNPDLVQAGVGVQAGDDQVGEKQVEDYRGRGQDIDPRGLVIAPPGRGTGMQVGGIEHPGDKECGLLRIPSSKPAPRGLRPDRTQNNAQPQHGQRNDGGLVGQGVKLFRTRQRLGHSTEEATLRTLRLPDTQPLGNMYEYISMICVDKL